MAKIKLDKIKYQKRKRVQISAISEQDGISLSYLRLSRQNEERRNRDSLEKAKSISIYQSLLDSEGTKDYIEIALKENISAISPNENAKVILSLCVSSLEYGSESDIHYTKIYKSKDGKNYSIKPLNIIFHLPELFHIFADAAMSATISLNEKNYYNLIFVALKSIFMLVPDFYVELTETATMLAYNIYRKFGTEEVDIKEVEKMLQTTDYDIKNFTQDIAILEQFKCIEKNSFNKQCIRLREKINLDSFTNRNI